MSEYVLVLNCGSSSLKFAVIDPQSGEEVCKGLAERLGQEGGMVKVKYRGDTEESALSPSSHEAALIYIEQALERFGLQQQLRAVGHRVVHGGEYFSASVRIDAGVRDKIADCIRLAPLHNPAHVTGIDAAFRAFPDLPQAAVFDTAFHQRMPEKAYLYALPMQLYREYHIRRYGFHGTSYRYVSAQMPALLNKDRPKLVVCHLGNGGSVAAIDGDHSVDTTMGLTPLEGIVHGTRSGDLDPAIPTLLISQFGKSAGEVTDLLWKQSGLLGLSGISNDCRTLEEAVEKGDADAKRALDIYCYRLAKNIAAQMVALGGCDALVFTGGIGENSPYVRGETVAQLAFLGFTLDAAKNADTMRGKQGEISAAGSKPVWVVPTNEELLIARDTVALCGGAA